MALGDVVRANVQQNSSALLLARVVNFAGELVVQADFGTIAYTVFDTTDGSAVTGHNGEALTVADVIFDELQTDDVLWPPEELDSLGFNFMHELVVSSNQPFPSANRLYRIEVTLTPAAGSPIPRLLYEVLPTKVYST